MFCFIRGGYYERGRKVVGRPAPKLRPRFPQVNGPNKGKRFEKQRARALVTDVHQQASDEQAKRQEPLRVIVSF